MLYTYPEYYNKFTCVADKCENTCCAGWQIVIDENSIENYKKINNEEFENVREYTLSISCPEVAKIILANKDKVSFISKEDEKEEVDDEFDVLMFSMLEDVRQVIYKIIQNRELTINERVKLMLNMADKCQELIDADDIFGINDVMDEYEHNLSECLKYINEDNSAVYEGALNRFRRLYELELLNELWANMTDETAQILYTNGIDYYNLIHDEFKKWLDENVKNHNIIWEQILVYFISTYFCGAVYDGNAYGKVEMSVTSLVCIYEMLLVRWIKNNKKLSFDDMVFITYMYSRELEHSDINLETLEEV